MKFLNNLKVEKIGDQDYILLEDLVYENESLILTVKKGFWFDAISIPKVFWSLIDSPFTGKAVRPATGHDVLYSSEFFDRKQCDDLFLEMMEADGVSYLKRYAMYWAVRAGGNSVWKEHKKEEVDEYKSYITIDYKPTI